VSSTQENSPTTVKSLSSDSSCTYGTHYPNRIFVGHLPGKANATDLADFFSSFGTVLEGKVVLDSYGRSRRFGFVTFTRHEDVQNVLAQGTIFFRGKKINVGPAVKKMFGIESSPPATPTTVSSGTSSPVMPLEDEGESGGEQIITIPPVNEYKEIQSPGSVKNGNVWLKVNAKPKSPMKKSLPELQSPTLPTFIYPQQQQQVNLSTQYQPYYCQAYYTVPYNQMQQSSYPYYMTYAPNNNMYSPTSYVASPLINPPQYIRGPLSVS